MTASSGSTEFRFEVAISFAGPHRDTVRAIAERISEAIDPGIEDRSKGRVFFDEWFEHEILGSDMDVLLQNFYHRQSLMVVADVSEEYAERPWTQAEARAIRALRFELNPARDETARLRLLNARFSDGEVPGVFKTEGTLDGINKSPEECANVILKRRDLLRERLGRRENLAITSAETSEVFKTSEVCPSPKGWVWHSTLATRAAGQVSVLAVVETLLAIILYWWIAIRFETHWHLVSSVFIAPLLLLRSRASMDAGVRWFLKDWFGLAEYENWPRGKRCCWFAGIGLVTCGPTYGLAHELSHRWLTSLQGWPQFGCVSVIGAGSIVFAFALTIAISSAVLSAKKGSSGKGSSGGVPVAWLVAGPIGGSIAVAFAAAETGAVVPALAGACAGTLAFRIVVTFAKAEMKIWIAWRVVASALPVLVFASGMGAGSALRTLVIRMFATLTHLSAGIRSLPANWRENSLLTDSTIPAELMPGIRDREPGHSMDVVLKNLSHERELFVRIMMYPVCIVIFLPVFLYRLNIKATAWFWWPLAYLLKPAPAASAEGEQRQALCWPWSNPAQRLLIGLSIGLALLSLVLHWLVATSRIESGLVTSLPLAVRVSLGWGWTRLAPWHVALWIIAAAGAGMLLLAGNACSHHANGNWTQYRQSWPQNVRLMTALSRVRRLAVVALLVMSLGALLLQDRTWQEYLPVPAGWVSAMEEFYQFTPHAVANDSFNGKPQAPAFSTSR